MNPKLKTLLTSLSGTLLAVAAFLPSSSKTQLALVALSSVLGNLSSIFAGRTGPTKDSP